MQFFRQAGDDGRIFLFAHMFQRTFQMQEADEASVIGHQHAVIHGFQPAIAVNRRGKRFGQGADAAIHAIDEQIEHHDSLFRTTC